MGDRNQRVWAVRSANDDTVFLYGFGMFVGDEPCPVLDGRLNPKIVLDGDAGIVWGCECWWGPESRWAEFLGDRKQVTVPVPDRDAPAPEPVPLDDLGHWEGTTFVLNEPMDLGQTGEMVAKIDFGQVQLEDGIRFQDVLEMLVNHGGKARPLGDGFYEQGSDGELTPPSGS